MITVLLSACWVTLLKDLTAVKSFSLPNQLGSTAIGIQTSEGVVLAVEKRITSPLMEASSVEKIVEIDSYIGKYHCGFEQ